MKCKYFKGQIVRVIDESTGYDSYRKYDHTSDNPPIIKPLDLTDPYVIASLAPEEANFFAQNSDSIWYAFIDFPTIFNVDMAEFKTWAGVHCLNWCFGTGIIPDDWTKEIYEIKRGENGGVFRVDVDHE